MADETLALMMRAGPRANLTRYDRELIVLVDREAAAFSAWYELMPRSWGKDGAHGTFDDVIDRLDYVKDLGFDVLYFPPIHPIGKTNRKGRNNSLTPAPDDPGSPYAIGSDEGGHRHVHPELGTLKDFDRLVKAARKQGPRGRDRLRHPVLARPPVDQASTPSGSTGAPTAPSSTPRTRRRSTRTSSTSTSTATRSPASGTSCATSCCSGSTTASRSSASTTPTPSRSRSGSG